MTTRPVSALLLTAALAGSAAFARVPAPPPTPAQIEADWLRQDAKQRSGKAAAGAVTAASDAAGGVDGVKNGEWGFHTENEKDPWWQVDLGAPARLGRVVLFNRCDGCAGRNARIQVLVSADGSAFRPVYRHDGSVFLGHPDGKPMVAKLDGVEARFIRLALEGTSYLHLDEVEVYAADGGGENIALHKPATQSSVSEWSVAHAPTGSKAHPLADVLARGRKLVESQRRLGASVTTAEEELRRIEAEAKALPADAADATQRALYLRARWTVRRLALANPLLAFDRILFVQRQPPLFPHMSDQHYGWWSRGGGALCVLEDFKSASPRVRSLAGDLPDGSFGAPDLSYDGTRVLFPYCAYHPDLRDEANKADKANVPEDAFHHIFEMNVDGTARRQLTRGKYDDFDARYLPGGDLVFVSTRKGVALQVGAASAEATRAADLPDSYVRCGGDNRRPVPVFTLHTMAADGSRLRPFSAFENFEWAPAVADDGRVLFTRWDYIDRFNGHFFSLWSANQDGTNPQLVYGNYTVRPQVKTEARSIPGSAKLVFTAAAHHSNTGGSLCLLDRTRGTEGDAPLTVLTPGVVFPETGGWPGHYYANPWPLSEEYFLVGWADAPMPPHGYVADARNPANAMGLYLLDAFGNQELLYRDPDISSMHPVPVAARPRPPVQMDQARWDGPQEGRFLLQDVARGLTGIAPGTIKRLRLVAVPPKVQPHMNRPVLGVSAEDPGKYVLGTVPVEADGSAYFHAPSGVPVFFQALDADGVAVQTMRTLTYLMPGQTLSCVGCHESRDAAPAGAGRPLAAARAPSRITPGPDGSWPLSFDRLVQPVLDRLCVECHRPGGPEVRAAQLDLAPGRAYAALLARGGGELKKAAFERDRSFPGQGVAATSRMWAALIHSPQHARLKLDADARERLLTWLDTYAHRQGHYSDAQAGELEAFKGRLAELLEPRNRDTP